VSTKAARAQNISQLGRLLFFTMLCALWLHSQLNPFSASPDASTDKPHNNIREPAYWAVRLPFCCFK